MNDMPRLLDVLRKELSEEDQQLLGVFFGPTEGNPDLARYERSFDRALDRALKTGDRQTTPDDPPS